METNKIYLGDALKLIKEITNKSIDLIYTDVPYLLTQHKGSVGKSALSGRISKVNEELKRNEDIERLEKRLEELKIKMNNASNQYEKEKWHTQRGPLLTKLNLLKQQDIIKGFDYSILDEFVRVMRYIYIYIYIYGVVRNKSMT